MLRGETVTVLRPHVTGIDERYRTPVREWVEERVPNVLVAPDSGTVREDWEDSTTPNALEATAVLYFPRTYGRGLRGCKVVAAGREWRVVGDPLPLDGGIKPTGWNREVHVVRDDGR